MKTALKILSEETPKEFFRRTEPSEHDRNFFYQPLDGPPLGVSRVLYRFIVQIAGFFPIAKVSVARLVPRVSDTDDNYEEDRALILANAAMREMPAAVLRQNRHDAVADTLLETPPIASEQDVKRVLLIVRTARERVADTESLGNTAVWRALGNAMDVAAWVLRKDEEYVASLSARAFYLANDWHAAIETVKKMLAVK